VPTVTEGLHGSPPVAASSGGAAIAVAPAAVVHSSSVAVPVPTKRANLTIYVTALMIAVAAGAVVFFYSRRPPALTEKDPIVLADFSNTTGDPVFYGTLKQALEVQLQQSPFLNIVPGEKIRETLRYMGRSPDERLTDEVTREICQRENLKAMLTGSIAALGR